MSVYKDNDAPGSSSGAGNAPGENLTDIQEGQEITSTDSGSPSSNLPGKERPDGTINWLGSSYTGVDIKIVAHLYGQVAVDKETEELQRQMALQQAIVDGCERLLANDLSEMLLFWRGLGSEEENFYLKHAGLIPYTEDTQDAAYVLLSLIDIARKSSADITIRAAVLRSQLQETASLYTTMNAELQEKVSKREEIRKKSTNTLVLGTLQTLSVQTHREKYPVRALGASYAKGYTRGPRTIAGSMIFTVFNEHSLAQLIRGMSGDGSIYGERDTETSSLITDQLPPIDLTIVFANEYGSLSQMGLYGVEFINNGMTLSIEDLLTEEVINFCARDIDQMTSRGNIRLSGSQRGMHYNQFGQDEALSKISFTHKDAYNQYLDRLKVRRRLLNR